MSLRESFVKLFTTSGLGLGIKAGLSNGFPKRNYNSDPSSSRTITASTTREMPVSYPRAVCGLGQHHISCVQARTRNNGCHIWESVSRNGLVIGAAIEKQFDAVLLVIVPELPDRPTVGI